MEYVILVLNVCVCVVCGVLLMRVNKAIDKYNTIENNIKEDLNNMGKEEIK